MHFENTLLSYIFLPLLKANISYFSLQIKCWKLSTKFEYFCYESKFRKTNKSKYRRNTNLKFIDRGDSFKIFQSCALTYGGNTKLSCFLSTFLKDHHPEVLTGMIFQCLSYIFYLCFVSLSGLNCNLLSNSRHSSISCILFSPFTFSI